MKNLYLIPTEKASKLWMTHLGNISRSHPTDPVHPLLGTNLNIHITSDDKIKEGEWGTDGKNVVIWSNDYIDVHKAYKKIILTTNNILVTDGVEEISEGFLTWFILKNPKCGFIELTAYRSLGKLSEVSTIKKETLEEAKIKNLVYLFGKDYDCEYSGNLDNCNHSFEQGAKWQEARSFSEEEMFKLTLEALDKGMEIRQNQLNGYPNKSGKELHKAWFEQYKKK